MKPPGRRAALLGLLPLGLAACGFKPVYAPVALGKPGVAQKELAAVAVDAIPDRPGQLLRQALQARLGSGSGVVPQYELVVGYGISGEGIGIQPDASTSRIRVVGSASWTLRTQTPDHAAVSHGAARSLDDYNVLDQQYFASDLENELTQRRLAEAIADQITIQLAAFFNHRAAVKG